MKYIMNKKENTIKFIFSQEEAIELVNSQRKVCNDLKDKLDKIIVVNDDIDEITYDDELDKQVREWKREREVYKRLRKIGTMTLKLTEYWESELIKLITENVSKKTRESIQETILMLIEKELKYIYDNKRIEEVKKELNIA